MTAPLADAASIPALPFWLELTTMSLSAFFGAVVSTNRRMPLLGIVIGGLIVGLGGGIVRDVLLNTMPFAISEWKILPFATFACLLGALCARWLDQSRAALVILQGLTLGLLVVIGAEKALAFQVPPGAVIILGMATASAGGAMLDALCGMRSALLSQGHWHLSSLLAGSLAFLLIYRFTSSALAEIGTVLLIVALRLISFQRGWNCPELPGPKA